MYTTEQVVKLLEKIEEFNAGVIDKALSKHIKKSYADWLDEEKPATFAQKLTNLFK